MVSYKDTPSSEIKTKLGIIPSFIKIDKSDQNIDWKTVDSFSSEWEKFDSFSEDEIAQIGNDYFDILPEEKLQNSIVLDMGCGSGRWSKYLVDKVKFIEAVDPSNSVISAQNMLIDHKNTRITQASVENLPFEEKSFDMVISLGVLHHIPDTKTA
ncbi:MAG: class I SAM-dependent methyltransferase, partial [Bacteroidota bacterium]